MMYVFYIRKSSSGQFEVSKTPLSAQEPTDLPMPGSLYQLSQEDIDNDFNLAMIVQKLNKDYSSVLGKNARIVKVMYQATNRMMYIVTFETLGKQQVTYRAFVDQDQGITAEPYQQGGAATTTTTTTSTVTSSTSTVSGSNDGVVDLSSQKASQKALETYTDLLG